MTALGIVLLVVGLAAIGLGIAGRIRAARLARPEESGGGRTSRNMIYEAKRLYENPELARYVIQLERSSNRLIVTGLSLCVAGVVLIV